jgi:hypothetical protein
MGRAGAVVGWGGQVLLLQSQQQQRVFASTLAALHSFTAVPTAYIVHPSSCLLQGVLPHRRMETRDGPEQAFLAIM